MTSTDVVVVGAGPAGIAAATQAARAGASVLVLDEYSQPGGQYYRQPAEGICPTSSARIFEQSERGHSLILEAKQAGVAFRCEALVWGAFTDGTLAVHSADTSEVITPGKLILACGAYDRSVAFPGWTLPGVMTAGAAQALLKGQGILPGRRILMAGTGPLQVAVAAQLAQAGARLVGVLEAVKLGRLVSSGPRFWGQWGRLREGLQYWRTLRSANVPLTFGRTVIRAIGDGVLSAVVTAELDDDWSAIPGTEAEVQVDTLCTEFGLVPNTRLARLLGCQIVYDPARGGLVPLYDDAMQSSRSGVFIVGEAAGIAGAKAAELQGRIAGISAALQLGKGDPYQCGQRIAAARRELRSELRFARSLNETFAVKPGILKLLTDDTIICRCEEITAGEFRHERPAWISTLDAARTVIRVGMGNCQGCMCESLVAQLLAKEAGRKIAEVGSYHIRPPLKPIPVGALADLSEKLPPPPNRMEH